MILKIKERRLFYIAIYVIGFILFSIIVGKSVNNKYYITKHNDFNQLDIIDNAIVKTENQDNIVKLPCFFSFKKPYELIYDLSTVKDLGGKIIDIHSFYSSFDCYIDGKPIYSYRLSDDNFIKSGSSRHHYIQLPLIIKSPKLHIKAAPLLGNKIKYRISPLVVSNGWRLAQHYLWSDILMITFSVLLFLIFIALTLFNIFTRDSGINWQFFHLSMLCLFMSLYIYCQSSFQFLLFDMQNYVFIKYTVEFITLATMTIPVIYMIQYVVDSRWNKILEIVGIALIVNIIIQMLVVLFFDIELIQMLRITHVLTVFSIVLIFASLVTTNDKEYPKKKRMFYSLIPVMTIFFVGIISYNITPEFIYKEFLVIGAILFVFINIYFFLCDYRVIQYNNMKMDTYRKISMLDNMTEIGNRYSYGEKVKYYADNIDYKSIGIILVDIDDFSVINKKLGFEAGDSTVMDFFQRIQHLSDEYETNVFRTGPDEFTFLIENINYENLQKIVSKLFLDKKKGFENEAYGIHYSFSIGSGIYFSKNNLSLENVILEAELQLNDLTINR